MKNYTDWSQQASFGNLARRYTTKRLRRWRKLSIAKIFNIFYNEISLVFRLNFIFCLNWSIRICVLRLYAPRFVLLFKSHPFLKLILQIVEGTLGNWTRCKEKLAETVSVPTLAHDSSSGNFLCYAKFIQSPSNLCEQCITSWKPDVGKTNSSTILWLIWR